MDTNKMREQFEAWAWKEYGQLLWWDMNYSEVFKRNGESYLTEFLSVRWEAYKASREAVVIELPEPQQKPEVGVSSYREGKADGIESGIIQCIKAIERQGFKVEA